jgi:hypothetical protein
MEVGCKQLLVILAASTATIPFGEITVTRHNANYASVTRSKRNSELSIMSIDYIIFNFNFPFSNILIYLDTNMITLFDMVNILI